MGKSTRKPQKIAAWIRPGTSRWSSFFWPSTITASFWTRSGTSSKRSTGLPSLTRSTSSFARRPNSVPADREHRGERERSERYVYEDCAFLSSAVIAGTISVRSPITA